MLAFSGNDGTAKTVSESDPLPVDIQGASVSISGDGLEISNTNANPVPVSDADGSLTVDNVSLGDPADSAASSDTGTFSIVGLIKRGLQNWTTLLARIPSNLTVTSTRLLVDGSGVTQPVSDANESLTVDGKSYRSTVTITRPSNTTAYAAGDVVGDTGGSAIITLTNIGPSGGFVQLQSLALVFSDSAVPSGMSGFRLHLYSASPAAIADNAVFDLGSGDRASYMGYVDFPAPLDLGSTLYSQADYPGRLLKLAASSTSLFAELQTLGAYTPFSASTVEVRVNALEAGL